MSDAARCGVLLVNTGTPDAPTPPAVRRYLASYLMDPRIAPMNRVLWWIILHLFILPKRGVASAEKYTKIWTDEGSPLVVAHEKLAHGLEAALAEAYGAGRVLVRCAMSYGNPAILAAVKELAEYGCERLIVLPTYPQSAYSTTGSVRDHVERAVKRARFRGEVDFIDSYHDNLTYVRAVAASIRHAGFEVDSDDVVVFSLHSIPLKDIEAGDTYELQVGSSCLQIASELGIDRKRWTIGYNCRFDKEREWLSPFTADVLRRWGDAGLSRVFLVCPGFAADCLETLYDVPYELEPEFRAARAEAGWALGEDDFVYVPCLDRSKAHVKVLFDVVAPHIEGDTGERGA